jgi:hypothetical protein
MEALAGDRDRSIANLVEAIPGSLPRRNRRSSGAPLLPILGACMNSLPQGGRETASWEKWEFLDGLSASETWLNTWERELKVGADAEWRSYVDWLLAVSRDDSRPREALAACIWLHGLYGRNVRIFPGYLPPAAIRLVERFPASASGAASGRAPTKAGDGFPEALERALAAGDAEAKALSDEIARLEGDGTGWHRHYTLAVWSLRMEVDRIVAQCEDPSLLESAEVTRLREIAAMLVE